MGYQYIRHRCSNAAWARVVSLRAAASTTDQCVVTKAGASGTSSRWLLSLAAIDLTLEKSAQTLQAIIRASVTPHYLHSISRTAFRYRKVLNEIVTFSVGSRSAVSIPCEENFILAKNMPLEGPKPGSSLLTMEGLPGRRPPGEAFWPAGTAGGQPASGAQIGFWVIRLLFAQSSIMTISGGVPPSELPQRAVTTVTKSNPGPEAALVAARHASSPIAQPSRACFKCKPGAGWHL